VSFVLIRTTVSPIRRPERKRPTRLGERGGGRSRRPDKGSADDVCAHGPDPGTLAAGSASARTGPGTGSAQVLVVDDEAAIRLICRLNLEGEGLGTLEAADGETGLAVARSEQPDLVLLDVMLPDIDGWRVAEELAADPATEEIPIVFLSARSDPADELRGYETGAVGYITKPFDAEAIGATLETIMERLRRGEREAIREEWRAKLGRIG
jgi:CheY-like chemotaxis protein